MNVNAQSGINKRKFALTLSAILLLSAAAFYFISIPNDMVTLSFRLTLIAMVVGFALAVGLYHLFLYAFASKERYFLLFAAFCLPIITRFGSLESNILILIAPGAAPAAHYIAEVSLVVLNALGVWFAHELLKLRVGGWPVRIVYAAALGVPLVMTLITGNAVGTWWLPLCTVPSMFIVVKAMSEKRCRKNPYIVAYICAMLYNALIPILLIIPFAQTLFVPLVPSLLIQMLIQMALISHSYGESKRREQKLTAEKERIGAELDIAAQIQGSMLPGVFPPFSGRSEFDLCAVMHPAKEVGGDFYDFFFVDKCTLAVVIADVSDKGIHSALFMVVAKTLIKSNAQRGMSPGDVFEAVNNLLCEGNKARMFVTAFLGYLHIPSGRFTYVNAGHNPPLICHGTEQPDNIEFTRLKTKAGFVLALLQNVKYSQEETTLQAGDRLFLYTDGVTDAENGEGTLFGEKRLIEFVNRCPEPMASGQLQSVKRELENFAGGTAQTDDITMLSLRYKSEVSEEGDWDE